jgi:hypothetical protein
MSIREFHSQLVSGNNKNNLLLSALRKLSQVANPQSLFTEEPAAEWPYWSASQNRSSLRPAADTV